MKDRYIIAGEAFASKAAVKRRAKTILRASEPYAPIQGQDFDFLKELFEGYKLRRGKPHREIVRIKVECHWSSRGFHVYFDDGGSDDISYPNACDSIDGFNVQDRKVKKALRRAIEYQIGDFKQEQLEQGAPSELVRSGEVDHLPPYEFCDLVRRFLDQERTSVDDIELERVPGCRGGFLPQGLSEKWRAYHLQHAILDLVTEEEHKERTRERQKAAQG